MTRSSLPVAAVTAAAAALLLAACGGGSNSSDKISSSDSPTGSASATATTASPTQAAGPTAPKFDLPSDIKINFDGFDSSDPTKKAALKDATYAATAVVEFTARVYTKEPAFFKRFWTGEHGAEFADSLIAQGKDGSVVTGTFNYYKPVVKTLSTGNLAVQYCEDQRKAYGKDAKTGKVDVTTPSLEDFNLWTLTMTKSSTGEWQAYDHTWQNGAKQCQIA
ncbi:hypothetical protein [Actinacidiphila sp. bgisy144]|uniref:hypothetical protein n=1 Tax=unclassified Actinacidiphila TaxID=2995708 RepID=UPI003EB7FD96